MRTVNKFVDVFEVFFYNANLSGLVVVTPNLCTTQNLKVTSLR